MEGVATFSGGVILFTQIPRKGVQVSVQVNGLSPGKHGFHIHKSGDLRRGCDSCCSHYNPGNKEHGGLEDINSHAGDLGNILADNMGNVNYIFYTKKFRVKEIIGRSIIIHKDEDDLGRGRNKDSKITGNSGPRIVCAVIGLSEKNC
jgi:Cu-Zn family superoxide dismutase